VLKDILITACAALGILGIAAYFWEGGLGVPRQVVDDILEVRGALTAAVVGALLLALLFTTLRRASYTHLVLAEVVLVGIPGAWILGHAGQTWANQAWDLSTGSIHQLTVWDKRVTRSRRRRSYHLELRGWPDIRADRSLQVSSSLFESVKPGDCLEIRWRAGYYGDPWIESWVPREACGVRAGEPGPGKAEDRLADRSASEFAAQMRSVYRSFDEREWQQSRAQAARAIELRPLDPWAHHAAGYAAHRMQDFDGAVAHLKEAARLAPQAADVWRDLGRSQMAARRFEEAEKSHGRALKLRPDDARTLADRAATRFLVNDLANALTDAQRSCELGYVGGCEIAREIASP
jgi:Tfp pilus assembly protein PilF